MINGGPPEVRIEARKLHKSDVGSGNWRRHLHNPASPPTHKINLSQVALSPVNNFPPWIMAGGLWIMVEAAPAAALGPGGGRVTQYADRWPRLCRAGRCRAVESPCGRRRLASNGHAL